MSSSYINKLRDTFTLYCDLGYSVIPILGNLAPQKPKVASIEWKTWQNQRTHITDFDRWTQENKVGGLALVTGRISQGLFVLDFDEKPLVTAFQRICPWLWNTRRVISAQRQLPQLYFQLPPHLQGQLRSQSFVGLDVQYEGRYIITPPTEIAGCTYRIEQGGLPLVLTEFTLARLQAFLQTLTPTTLPPSREIAGIMYEINTNVPLHANCAKVELQPAPRAMLLPPISPEQALQKYERLAPAGRNNALFETALTLRDSGYAQQNTLNLLLPLYIQHKKVGENATQRQHEAELTIASVYSRPARERQGSFPAQLPNALREEFNRRKQTALSRVYEALLSKNWRPGDLIYYTKAVTVCKTVGVGQFSVRRFFVELPELLNKGIVPLEPPSALSGLPPATADCYSTNAICKGGKNQPKIKTRGRPQKFLRLPTFAEIAAALRIKSYVAVDVLPLMALASVKTYRQAQHKAFVIRCPDFHSNAFLQRRYGVSRRTQASYARACQIERIPHFNSIPIVWDNLNEIPSPEYLPSYTNRAKCTYTPGWFLEDEQGKRYPALRGLAQRLLKQGHRLTLKVQTANYHHVRGQRQAELAFNMHQTQAHQTLTQRRQHFEQRLAERSAFFAERATPDTPKILEPSSMQPPLPLLLTPTAEKGRPANTNQATPENTCRKRTKSTRQYREPLEKTGCEQLAQRMQTTAPKLSLGNARRLVDEYGYALCQAALQALRQRGGVRDRAAWLCSYLRSEAKWTSEDHSSDQNRRSTP